MTLEIKKLRERNILISFLILVIGCLAIGNAIGICMTFGPIIFTVPYFSFEEEKLTSIPNDVDLGKVNGFCNELRWFAS
jgi:hypothetical protein